MVLPVGDVNPTRRRPVLTVALIACNIVVFLLLQPHPEWTAPASRAARTVAVCEEAAFYYRWAAVPEEVTSLEPLSEGELRAALGPCAVVYGPQRKSVLLSLLTAMFLHANLAHLLGNMLFLWIFGNNVEDRLGHLRYLGFYLVGGVVATVAFSVLQPGSLTPLLGASGAIAAVLGAYLVMFPRARVRLLAPFPTYLLAPLVGGRIVFWGLWFAVVEVIAVVVLGGWFLLQLAASAEPAVGGGVAYEAHIAGFVAGVVMALLLRPAPARR